MDAKDVRRQIVETVKREYAMGMVNLFEGNVSMRLGDRYFITPSQVSKLTMTDDMVIEIDKDGNIVEAMEGLKPSSELFMHLEVYKLRPDVNAVVHNHSLYATAFAMNAMPLKSDSLTEMNMTMGEVPVVPYGTPGTDRIYKDFEKYLGNRNAVLLANHGVLAFGPSMEIAFSFAEAVEKIANTIYIARQLGPESKIPQPELDGLRAWGDNARTKAIISLLANK